MKRAFQLTVLLATVATAQSTLSTGPPPADHFSTTIRINVSCDDPGLKNQILSSFNSEIRRLGDVVIADLKDNPEYALDIVAVTSREAGTDVGYGMSLVVRRSIVRRLRFLANSLKEHPTEEEGKARAYGLLGLLMFGTEILDQKVIEGTSAKLPNIARVIISDLDVKSLDSDRRDWAEAQKAKPAAPFKQ